jgi:hypothetical protein
MEELHGSLAYLLLSWGVITGMLFILVVYRATLGTRESDQLYLNDAEDAMMASEQRVIVERMNRLGTPILVLSVLSGVLLLGSLGMWLWGGLQSF